MKKKLLSIVALASLMVLGGCGNKESANPTTPKPTETTNKTTEGPKPTETSRPTENLPTEPVVKDAATRHKEYLENYGDKTKSITIQGKVVHAVSYSGSENCNIAIQEGKYGYWMNNVPKASIEIGKSYVFTGVGSAKSYPSLNMKGGTITATDDIAATPLVLGDAANSFEDSKDAYATIPEGGVVITSADQDAHKYGFMIGEKEFFVSYNKNVTEADALNEKVATLVVGSKVTKLSGTWYAEDTINLYDPSEIEFTAPAAPTATGVTITAADNATEVQATGTLQLTAVVTPAGANQKVVWSSEKEDIATVSATGLVTGVKIGTTKIFATAEGTEIKGEYSITVTAAPAAPVESITIAAEGGKTGADIGETVQLTTTVLPDNALQAVTWTSSDETVATVDNAGLVTFVGDGEVTITAAATDESGKSGTIKLATEVKNLKTAAEIVELAKGLKNNTTTAVLNFRGVVSGFKDDTNFIMRDATGLIQAFNVTKSPKGLKVGDVVLVKARFVKYNTLIEIKDDSITSMVISKKTVEGVATTATKKTKDEMIAMTSKAGFSKGEYLEFDNAKAFKDGSYTNVNIEGTVAKIGLTPLKGVSFDLDKWGTFKGYVLSMSNNVTFWVESFTANAETTASSIEITGKDTLKAKTSTVLTATVKGEGFGNIADETVTWSVANKDTTVTTPLATIDETGKLTAGSTAGVVVVTATSNAVETVKQTFEVTITADALKSYSLLKVATELKEGDKIVMAYNAGEKSFGLSTSNSGIYNKVDVVVASDTITETEGLVELTVAKGNQANSYAFFDGTGYLGFTGTKNKMPQVNKIDIVSSFTVTIDAKTGVAKIVNCNYPQYRIQYNATNPRFACYNGSQKDVSIFKLATKA